VTKFTGFGYGGRLYSSIPAPSAEKFCRADYVLKGDLKYRFRLWLSSRPEHWSSDAAYVVGEIQSLKDRPIVCKIAYPNRAAAGLLNGTQDQIGTFFDLFSLFDGKPWGVHNENVISQLCLAVQLSPKKELGLFVKNLFWRVTQCCIPPTFAEGLTN